MELLLREIQEIGKKAELCFERSKDIVLPRHVPYLGMGSSYFAALTLKYCGFPVLPDIASEYFHYLSPGSVQEHGVLISQSGKSSEVLWCKERFRQYTAITNNPDSPLAIGENKAQLHLLHAGPEEGSSTKTYINTLITLYTGFRVDVMPVLKVLNYNVNHYAAWGESMAEKIFSFAANRTTKGFYIIANGPNIGTACQAALVLSETTKLPFQAMAVSQFDHGPKEVAKDSFILAIQTEGPMKERVAHVIEKVKRAGAETAFLEEFNLPEALSPFTSILAINYLMYYLGLKLGIENIFQVGGKVTEVQE